FIFDAASAKFACGSISSICRVITSLSCMVGLLSRKRFLNDYARARVRAAFRAAAERLRGPLVRTALRAAAERLAAERWLAAVCACRASALCDAARWPSRRRALVMALERRRETLRRVPPWRPARLALAAL